MLGRWVYPILIVLFPALLLAIALPGHRTASEAAAVVTVNWQSPATGGIESFEQVADLSVCRQAQRQAAHGGGPVTVECRAGRETWQFPIGLPLAARNQGDLPP